MERLYVVGGKQRGQRALRDGNNAWNGYERGRILAVDPGTGEIARCLDYVSPPEVCAAEDPAITFQASTIRDGHLYTCTQTEVMVYSLPDLQLQHYLSLPIFNDLHHVRPGTNGTLFVANAGLEQVLELTVDGEIVRAWHVLGEAPWDDIDEAVDYRKVSTKPHRSHPNYLSEVDGELWVTRFHQGDTLCLTQPGRRILLSEERIHDGVYHDGLLYFTTVDAKVVVANPHTFRVEETINVAATYPEEVLPGWCRGIWIEGDHIWLGFSRIRPTKLRENVAWVMRGFKHSMPTRIICYDRARGERVREIDLEGAGLNAVYSIFPVSV